MKQVCILIVTYNSERDIFDCVRSILSHADIPKEEIELIIVDNASSNPDPMFARLKDLWGDDIVLLKNEANGGYGQGNNVGIRHASAPVILVMNPDVRLADDFFSRPLEAFRRDEHLVMYGMKQMLSPTQPSRDSFWVTTAMNGYVRTVLTSLCNHFDIYCPRWMYFSGSCFFVRKAMFDKVGLFDEAIFMYGEESDIHIRLLRRFGPHFCYDKNLHYIHLIANRKNSLGYEKKLIEADLYVHEKNGRSPAKTLRTHMQINSILLARCYLRKLWGACDEENLELLKAVRSELRIMQSNL